MAIYGVVLIGAFLMGSLPTGYLVASAKGINIKKVGSGNIGATNVTRVMGKGWGAFVLIVDALKGLIPVLFVKAHFGALDQSGLYTLMAATGVLAVAGHVFTPFLGFKGGKGIATSLGMLLGISPVLSLSMVIVWLIAFLITRVSSVGALCAAVSMPFIALLLFHGRPVSGIMTVFTAFMALFILFTHRENIGRLSRGEEKAFRKR